MYAELSFTQRRSFGVKVLRSIMSGPGSYWYRVSLYGRYFGGLSGVCYYQRRERQGRYFQDCDKQHAFMVLVNLLNEVDNHVGEYSEL
jgi:hypothetical protein